MLASYSLVIGSPADQYMCKRKPWTEADLSDGLLQSPESGEWSVDWLAMVHWLVMVHKSSQFCVGLKVIGQDSTSGRSPIFSIDNPTTTSKSFLSKSQELHPCHFAHRVSWISTELLNKSLWAHDTTAHHRVNILTYTLEITMQSFYEPIPFRATSRVGLLYIPKHCILSALAEQPEGHANS